MKRIAILSLAVGILTSSFTHAQVAVQKTESVSKAVVLVSDLTKRAADTLSNATTKTQTATIPGYNDLVTVQVFLNKISGTAAGKVYLLGSINGTDFTRAGGADSLTVVNVASQNRSFIITPSQYTAYRIQFVGGVGATQSVRFNSIALFRKR